MNGKRVFLHKRGKDEIVATEYPADPREGRYPYYYVNDHLAYFSSHTFPGVVAKELEKALPTHFVIPEHVGEYSGLWICSVELPKLARERGWA